jgi:hypothetical protein
LEGEVAVQFLAAVLSQDRVKRLLSSEHFTVDGTLLEAWASPKSFRPKDGLSEPPGPGRNAQQNFHGERRTNDTHCSTTDPDARLYRKGLGKEARLFHESPADGEPPRSDCWRGDHPRFGPCRAPGGPGADPLHADRPQPITLGTDKGSDGSDFVMELCDKAVTRHVAQNTDKCDSCKIDTGPICQQHYCWLKYRRTLIRVPIGNGEEREESHRDSDYIEDNPNTKIRYIYRVWKKVVYYCIKCEYNFGFSYEIPK